MLDIQISDRSLGRAGTGRKRAFEDISGIDEESYARKHLATEGSVFSRPKSRAPRTFLWRVLNDRHTLELQCIDLAQDRRHLGSECCSDSWLTFRISLSDAIIPRGVALADDEARDALDVFVITPKGLYTVTLRRDLLLRETVPVDFDPISVYKHYPLGHRAYRITAVSSLFLLVSLENGDFIRLERGKDESGSQWRQLYVGEGGWSGLTGLKGIWSKTTVKHGELHLMPSAMIAMAMSPDDKHIWTVGIDHVLKAWDTNTGKAAIRMDLLEDSIGQEDRRKQAHIDPGQGTVLQVVDSMGVPGTAYFLVCYSPRDHQFRFFAITHREEKLILVDTQPPEAKLNAPIAEMLGTSLWNLEQFHVSPGPQWNGSQMWLRARSGGVCETFVVTFDLLGENGVSNDFSDAWKNDWTRVENSSLSIEALRRVPSFADLDPTSETTATSSEKWLKYLFYPGRFSEASLEAALAMYRKTGGVSTASRGINKMEEPLKGRLVSAVIAKTTVGRHDHEKPDYHRYQLELCEQWQIYFRLLSHLHALRLASIGFAYDDDDGLPWSVCADVVAPIRQSSEFELVAYNSELVQGRHSRVLNQETQTRIWPNPDEDLLKSQILAVARQLRQCLSPSSQEKLLRAAIAEALDQSADKSALLGIQNIYDQCNIGEEISNEDFDAITEAATVFNGLGRLDDDSLLMVLEAMDTDLTLQGTDSGRALQRYGKDLTIAITQQTLQDTQAVLLDILALVLFMHGDLEPEELDENFHPCEMYDSIIFRLKTAELRLWLVEHMRLEPKKVGSTNEEPMAMTLYESLFIGDWRSLEGGQPRLLSQLVTAWSKSWALGIDPNENWTGFTDYVMANLVQHKEWDLALDFVRFLSETTPWATYLKGRVHMARGEFDMASLAFDDAADELSHIPDAASTLSHLVLSVEDMEYFGQGLARYFQHISGLYESVKAFSYTGEYANLAFRHLRTGGDVSQALHDLDELKREKGSALSIPQLISAAMEELYYLKAQIAHDSILGRLFSASHQINRFDEAYSALAQIMDPIVRRSNLRILVSRCIKEDAVPDLLSLPIAEDLVQTVDAELLGLAKSSMGTSNTQLSGPPYHQILFAFRIQHSDFRGAASLLYTHLEYLKFTNPHAMKDPDDDTLIQVYVLLINTLVCCGEGEAWLLAEAIEGVHPAGTKRRLVRLEDVRREYAEELDRRSEVQMGRFAVSGGDHMEMF